TYATGDRDAAEAARPLEQRPVCALQVVLLAPDLVGPEAMAGYSAGGAGRASPFPRIKASQSMSAPCDPCATSMPRFKAIRSRSVVILANSCSGTRSPFGALSRRGSGAPAP